MARYHAETVPVLKSWDDVNRALREMALEEIALADILGDMEKQIIGVKKVAEVQSKPHTDRIARLARDVEEYVTAHKTDLGNAKTKVLTFGECGFRRSVKITVPTMKLKLAEVIRNIRAHKLDECVIVKETVDRNALKKYGEEVVKEVGAKWVQKDDFWCEPAREKLEKLQAGQSE